MQITQEKSLFYNLLNSIELETNVLKRRTLYKNAIEQYKNTKEKINVANILNPTTENEHKDFYKFGNETISKIQNESQKLTVTIFCDGDWNNRIYNSICRIFSKTGFTISNNGNYFIYISINNNKTDGEPFSVFPSLDLNLMDTNGNTIYSYSTQVNEKTTGYKIDFVMKKACQKLVDILDTEFLEDLKNKYEIILF